MVGPDTLCPVGTEALPEDAVDYAIQRKNMVESQVRPSDVTDRRIIRAMLDLPREAFVPERVRSLAYMDGSVQLTPAGDDARRALLPARVFAKLVQAAEIGPTSAVLDVGTATGYSAAVLARLAGQVVALDCDSALLSVAREVLPTVDAAKVQVVEGSLTEGWPSAAPYDAILVEGAIETVPQALLEQLKDGGRLVAIVGGETPGRATVWQRDNATFGVTEIFDAAANVLPGFEKKHAFAF